jgi:bacillithiol biosynthesis cysteine-adding enzyme BshC
MDCTATRLSYRQTNYFTRIVLDYIEEPEKLESFFSHPPSLEGIKRSVEDRKRTATDRVTLVQELLRQYEGVSVTPAVEANIQSLLSENTFTVTTAHQPNIFTGPLYFLYKIIHAIKLAEYLSNTLVEYRFVPVYYMGSEDADLNELGHIYLDGEKLSWQTKQTGAVGRMLVDKELLKIVDMMEGQLLTEPFGREVIDMIRDAYKAGDPVQAATFRFVNALFGKYGIVVLIPDNEVLKRKIASVFHDDLENQIPSAIVHETSRKLETQYKVQANPRDINLFYLENNLRERIEFKRDRYEVLNTDLSFSREELLNELSDHPERFSPNVILRGLFQETILPNIVFIGGGGELAYWLQLKDLFVHYHVPYPVLLLRNSFLLIEKKWQDKIDKMQFSPADFFLPGQELLNELVARESKHEVKLNGSLVQVEKLYDDFKKQAAEIDRTLAPHVDALKTRSLQRLQELEKKMLRAEKRKFTDQQRHIGLVKDQLFPKNNLQERIDNFSYYYAKWGSGLIDRLYEFSISLKSEFVILSEKE